MKVVFLALGLLTAIFGVVGTTTPALAAQMRSLSVGLWQGGSYNDDQTKQFTGCVATVRYNSGIFMTVSINRSFGWSLGFSNPTWALQQDQQVPLEIAFDGRAPWGGTANAINKTMVMVPMADNSVLINAFRAGLVMTVKGSERTFIFNLGSTSRLIVELVQCVKNELAIEKGERPPTFAANPQPGPPTRSASPTPPQGATTAELELVATRIATNLLLQAKFPNAQLLTRAETPEAIRRLGVAWKSDVGFGAIELLPATAGADGQTVASSLLGADAATCKGDFVSGRSSELVDNTIVTKAFSGCKDSDGTATIRYFIIHRDGGPYVVFALAPTVDNGALRDAPAPNDTIFQAAAVKVAFTK